MCRGIEGGIGVVEETFFDGNNLMKMIEERNMPLLSECTIEVANNRKYLLKMRNGREGIGWKRFRSGVSGAQMSRMAGNKVVRFYKNSRITIYVM